MPAQIQNESAYFEPRYGDVRFPLATAGTAGLRRAQHGAISSITAHFTIRKEPAIIVMPTGSGKTGVLMMTPFTLRAKRVLVLTPSRLVRNQIATNFGSLDLLKRLGVLPHDTAPPEVREIDAKPKALADWEALREFDVVVGIPNTISPAAEGNAVPPADLFDLILVDEAHHSPARVWAGIFTAFQPAKKVLFTATPSRRDQKEIRGLFTYVYPLREAFNDGIFGRIEFRPVAEISGTRNDVLIAKKAEELFLADRAAGMKHALMVRTDGIDRSKELTEVYARETSLKLETIHSGLTARRINSTIDKLRNGQLDGIICVAMLGEGFDFPNLKIAAIHAPHKSLEVTLQFIGRFARTGGSDIGTAKFVAVPSEIEIESQKLYSEDALWQEIVENLSETKIQQEERVRQALQTFDRPEVSTPDTEDVSLYSLKPFNHVKVYRIEGEVNFERNLSLGSEYEIVYKNESQAEKALIFITKESVKPRWTPLPVFFKVEYDLFVVYFDEATKLLFVNSSRRNEAIYEKIVDAFALGDHRRLSLSQINRVLLDLTDHDFFSIGMKNRMQNNNVESYRIISGASTQNAVDSGTARLFHQGHLFGKAESPEGPVTIGYSSASKIWSNRNTQIPELIDWCKMLATKLTTQRAVTTNSPVDMLSVGKEVDAIPEGAIAAGWDERAFKEPPLISLNGTGEGGHLSDQLLNLEIAVTVENTQDEIEFSISNPFFRWEGIFSLSNDRYFSARDQNQPAVRVAIGENSWPLEEYLNYYPLVFYFADFSTMRESVHVTYPDQIEMFPRDQIEAIDWTAAAVDTGLEFGVGTGSGQSIHDYLRDRLVSESGQVVVYDHGTGEMADFVVATDSVGHVEFAFYHCKGSGGTNPGDRVGDVYEVCGQVIKSTIWLSSLSSFKEKLLDRIHSGSQIVKGDLTTLNTLFESAKVKSVRFSLFLVQPGISKGDLSEKLATILGAADQFVRNNKAERVRVLASV